MTLRFLLLDRTALETIDAALIDREWFKDFNLPENSSKIKRVIIGDSVHIIHEGCDERSSLLVLDLEALRLTDKNKNASENFGRIVRIALHYFDREVSIPSKWGPYRNGSTISVYAETAAKKSDRRIFLEINPSERQGPTVFAYSTIDDIEEQPDVGYNAVTFLKAIKGYGEAALAEVAPTQQAGNFGIILSNSLGTQLSGLASLDEWYNSRVTSEQRAFIDHPLTSPVRLRGAAGTGKTQSIAIKCLVDLGRLEAAGRPAKLAVITHSWALAHEVIRGMMEAMDPTKKWTEYKHATLWFGTLYELAQEWMSYESKGLQPLSSDGREGREIQKVLIEDAVASLKSEVSFRSRVEKCSPEFRQWITDDARYPYFIDELMNEFACIIDAENIRLGTESADGYIKRRRDPWNWNIPNEMDRRFILEIHQKYSIFLEKERYLSMDQMIADFNRYLLTHGWRQLRDENGFDALFIDEYHYFNRAECMSMHNLLKSSAGIDGKKPIFMAYDLKQGPNDVAVMHSSSNMQNFIATRAGTSDLVELTKVFRSTPEIMEFMKDVDGSHPTMNYELDWSPIVAESSVEHGNKPKLLQFATDVDLIDGVFKLAKKAVSEEEFGGRDVAVLCMNERLFDVYREAGRIRDFALPITSREQMKELNYARRKCIFSMPEYMAGLQFQTVFMIHVDESEYHGELSGPNALRRFVSRFYLGATRAKQNLIVATSKERGGPSSILSGGIASGSLRVGD